MKVAYDPVIGLSGPRSNPPPIHYLSTTVILLCAFYLLLAPSRCFGQPNWAKDYIKAADTCVFNSEAAAAVLYKDYKTNVAAKESFDTDYKIIYKVLAPQGADDCRLIVPVYGGIEVKGLKGWRIRPNGQAERLEKSSIVEVGLSTAAGYHDDAKNVIAVFPSLQTGDIVVFEYSLKGRHIWDGFHRQFLVQNELPIKNISIEVTIPEGWDLRTSSRHCEPLSLHQDENKYTWTGSSLAYRPDEPHMLPNGMTVRLLEVSCYPPESERAQYHRDWRGVSQWALDLYETATEPDSSIRDVIGSVCENVSSRADSIEAVCEFVRDRIRYVAVELGEGRFRPRSAVETCFNKYGDCKDKVTLARSMLMSMNVPSYPVLASVGSPVDPEFPSPFQFNHVILSIPCDVGQGLDSTSDAYAQRSIYFDPTDESTAFGQLPPSLHGARVLRISPDDSSLVRLPTHRPDDYRRVYDVAAGIDEKFTLSAHLRVSDYGYRAAQVAFWRKQNGDDEEKEQIVEALSENLSKPAISNFVAGNSADSAWVEFDLSAANYVNMAGPMAISHLDFLPPIFWERFTEDERIHAIWFGNPRVVEHHITWTIPSGWAPTSSAAAVADSCAIGRLDGTTAFNADTVHYRLTYTCLGDTLSSANYDSARRFERSLNSFLTQQLVLEKRGE